jgi:hypothetical protein
LLGFFSSNWQHKRIEQELQNARTLSDKRREADHRRALKNNGKNWRRARMSLANARARTIGKSVTILIPPDGMMTFRCQRTPNHHKTISKHYQNHIETSPQPP